MNEIMEILKQIEDIHRKKNADYATEESRYQNFERSAIISSWFKRDLDKSFTTLIGTKLARLGVLLSRDSVPENEPITDSLLDLCTYCILWYGKYRVELGIPNVYLERIPPITAQQVSKLIEQEFSSDKLKNVFERTDKFYATLKNTRTNPTGKTRGSKVNLARNVKRSNKKANKRKHK